MGKFNPDNNNALYQELTNVFADASEDDPNAYGQTGGIWSMAAYFNGQVYFGPVHGPITVFFHSQMLSWKPSLLNPPLLMVTQAPRRAFPANGISDGIVWAMELVGNSVGQLWSRGSKRAFCMPIPRTISQMRSTTDNQATNRPRYLWRPEISPRTMIASGRVYTPTSNGVAGNLGCLSTTTLTPIQLWRNTNFGNPSNVGAGANTNCPAGDSVANVVKYALGLNPFTPVQNPTNLASRQTYSKRRPDLSDNDGQSRCRSVGCVVSRPGFHQLAHMDLLRVQHDHAHKHADAVGHPRQHAGRHRDKRLHAAPLLANGLMFRQRPAP